ncbi:endonuclease/exonuclease/phosphatase family protein [Actinoplanes rectilineatus]|uniref:endonuclease/exonuclease/phosphatase family protein n=1 Tax=Actinoplanes rectilineatus TaxID=113571 RepID=UPI000698901E|nr:endonuclease/exonuclease/phosphatase family protein [Actinoplanes rectilineatus]
MRTLVRRILAVAAALLLVPVTAPQAAQAATTKRLTGLQWNVSGGWKYQTGGATTLMINTLFDAIMSRNPIPDFVALNEVCQSQYSALITKLQATDWPADETNFARFQATRNAEAGPDNPDVCQGNPVGIALFSRQPLGAAIRIPLEPNPAFDKDEIRHLLCAPTTTMTVKYCVTHITPTPFGTAGKAQLEQVLGHVEQFEAAGETVLVAGDFNGTPRWPEFDVWYHPSVDTTANSGNTGNWREMDDADPYCLGYGEGTTKATTGSPCGTGTKIDMIFFPNDRLAGQHSGDSLPLSTCGNELCSDHRIVWGWADLSID